MTIQHLSAISLFQSYAVAQIKLHLNCQASDVRLDCLHAKIFGEFLFKRLCKNSGCLRSTRPAEASSTSVG